jgi:hypothetical protein
VIFTLRFKMPPEASRELWSAKYQQNRSDVRFATRSSWTLTRFPFHTSSAKKLNITDPPIITVIGKVFFDVGHSLKNQASNRRKNLLGYAVWEIQPVMKIESQ